MHWVNRRLDWVFGHGLNLLQLEFFPRAKKSRVRMGLAWKLPAEKVWLLRRPYCKATGPRPHTPHLFWPEQQLPDVVF